MLGSKSLGSLRQRSSQAKVRSTNQRCGSTSKPAVCFERLMIPIVHFADLVSASRRGRACGPSDGPFGRSPRQSPTVSVSRRKVASGCGAAASPALWHRFHRRRALEHALCQVQPNRRDNHRKRSSSRIGSPISRIVAAGQFGGVHTINMANKGGSSYRDWCRCAWISMRRSSAVRRRILRALLSAPRNQRTDSTCIFAAVRPKEGKGASLILPACTTEAMNTHLVEIAATIAAAAHAVLQADQAGWHMSTLLIVQANITIILLPKYRAVPARNLALKPRFQVIRRSSRPMLRRLEQVHRSDLADHVHRIATMSTWVQISGIRYH